MDKFISIRNKSDTISFSLSKKTCMIAAILFCLSLFTFILHLAVGVDFIHPSVIITYLMGVPAPEYEFVLHTLRMPRAVLAFLVGAALAVSGLILQGVVRNPLASPDIIGITGGASVGAVTFIVFFSGSLSMKLLPLAALLGAGVISILIYILSWKKGVIPIRFILIGIGISAAMKALITMMIVLNDTVLVSKAYLWLTGSLYAATWEEVFTILPWVIILIPVTMLFSRTVNVNELGDDIALGLGVRVQLYRMVLIFISVALAGVAVATAGGISFVGLIAPHIARMIAGRSFSGLILISAMIGGIIVIMADIVARIAFQPLDIPAGVFTAGIGAPFFIYLLYKNV